jgi:hypothetical protein
MSIVVWYLSIIKCPSLFTDKLICLTRYSSDAARNSCASDDLNNTSSTLRQEAISITRVRCKRRKTWIRAPSSPARSPNENRKPAGYLQQRRLKKNLIQPFLSNNESEYISEGNTQRRLFSVQRFEILKMNTITRSSSDNGTCIKIYAYIPVCVCAYIPLLFTCVCLIQFLRV